MRTLKRFQRVVQTTRGLYVQKGTRGRVVKQDFNRSTNGYDTLVVWHKHVSTQRPRRLLRTWAPAESLVAYETQTQKE